MSTNRALAVTLAWLLPVAAVRAQESGSAPPRPIVCQQEPRCFAAVNHALETAKTSKKEALRLMLLAYAEFPDPRLCFNIGRLFQQTAEPLQAAQHYRKFLDSGAELDPDRLAKARGFLAQAEKDTRPPLPSPTEPPQSPRPAGMVVPVNPEMLPEITVPTVPPHPASGAVLAIPEPPTETTSTAISRERLQSARPAWRIAVGSLAQVGGLVAIGFGAAALRQNGQCVHFGATSSDQSAICIQFLDTTSVGAGILTSGVLLVLGGTLTVTIPSRRPASLVTSQLRRAALAQASY